MTPKTIIYAGLFELPDEDAAAHRVNGIGKILNCLGYDIVYVGFSDEPEELSSYNTECSEYVGDRKPKNRNMWLRMQTSAEKVEKQLMNHDNVEALILYNYPSVAFEKIRGICRKRKIKLYIDCTEWHHSGKGSKLSFIKNLDTFKRMHFDNMHSDGLIVISSFLANYYRKKRTVLIPPVFDYEVMRRGIDGVNANEIRTFVFTGTVSEQKETIMQIVEAADSIAKKGFKISLKIFGVTLDEFMRNGTVQKPDSCVEFYGRVSHERCLDEIRKADFQIFTRKRTRVTMAGFPTKFAESFSCGTPVISTNTSDLYNYLLDGVTGFFVDEDLESVMEKAIKLTSDQMIEMKKNVQNVMDFDFRNHIDHMADFMEIEG
jgi:glycosyltransferase involved in cell wall biosynthesis